MPLPAFINTPSQGDDDAEPLRYTAKSAKVNDFIERKLFVSTESSHNTSDLRLREDFFRLFQIRKRNTWQFS